ATNASADPVEPVTNATPGSCAEVEPQAVSEECPSISVPPPAGLLSTPLSAGSEVIPGDNRGPGGQSELQTSNSEPCTLSASALAKGAARCRLLKAAKQLLRVAGSDSIPAQ